MKRSSAVIWETSNDCVFSEIKQLWYCWVFKIIMKIWLRDNRQIHIYPNNTSKRGNESWASSIRMHSYLPSWGIPLQLLCFADIHDRYFFWMATLNLFLSRYISNFVFRCFPIIIYIYIAIRPLRRKTNQTLHLCLLASHTYTDNLLTGYLLKLWTPLW